MVAKVALDEIGAFGPLIGTLFVDGQPTVVSCSIPAGQTSCMSSASVAVPPYSLIAVQLDNTEVGDSESVAWSMTIR